MTTTKLEQAARQALEALKWCVPMGSTRDAKQQYVDAYAALQKALAGVNMSPTEQAEQEPVADYAYQTIEEYEELCGMQVNDAFKIGWNMARTTNAMLGIKAAPIEPVKQEPIGYQYLFSSPFGGEVWRDSESMWNGNKPKSSRAIYAAPVRTKNPCNPLQDLTDDEINELWLTHGQGQMMYMHEKFARAVIAADREKNK